VYIRVFINQCFYKHVSNPYTHCCWYWCKQDESSDTDVDLVRSIPTQNAVHKDYVCRRTLCESLYCDLVYNALQFILQDGKPVLAYGL
jgi:hypothetical protein